MQIQKLLPLVVFIAMCVSHAMANPTINWTPSTVSETTVIGGQSTVQINFTSQEALSDVTFSVAPRLAPFVTVSPATIDFVPANSPQVITLNFSVPLDVSRQLINGNLTVTSAERNLAQPLHIKLSTTEPQSGPVPELLNGAVFPPTTVPQTRLLQYTTKAGDIVNIEVIEGRVNVLFDQSTNEKQREKQIENLGGVVVAKVPAIGLYLAEVQLGNENTFIGALRTVPGVIYAEPDLPAVPHVSRPNEWLSNSLLALNSWEMKLINAPRAWD